MITREHFGTTSAGQGVERYSLTSPAGLRAAVITYGAALQALEIPDRRGRLADVAPGFPSVEGYERHAWHFGAIIGRTCGRVRDGKAAIGGRAYQLTQNTPPHHLHGGEGFNRKLWLAETVGDDALELSLVSPDGEEGYPGELRLTVRYRWAGPTRLLLEFEAASGQDTLCNPTTHAYFNLAGQNRGDILNHWLRIRAGRRVELDSQALPTGRVLGVEDFGPDPRRWRQLRDPAQPDRAVLSTGLFLPDGPPGALRPVADVWEQTSGRHLRVSATQGALQYYGGYRVADCPPGKDGAIYGPYCGLCLEPQAVTGQPAGPGAPSAFLAAGERYRETIRYDFGVSDVLPGD